MLVWVLTCLPGAAREDTMKGEASLPLVTKWTAVVPQGLPPGLNQMSEKPRVLKEALSRDEQEPPWVCKFVFKFGVLPCFFLLPLFQSVLD